MSAERPDQAANPPASQKLTVELQTLDPLLPLNQRLVPLERIASRIVTVDQTVLESLLNLDDTLLDRLLGGETKPLFDFAKCKIVGPLVRIIRDIVHGNIRNDIQHKLRELRDLVVHAFIADVENFSGNDIGIGFETLHQDPTTSST